MAIYHCSVKNISRSSGRSAVAAVAYRAGEKLTNERDGITHDYRRKSGVKHSEIMLPENAPKEYHDRNILWNAVEQIEKSKDARTAREIEVALPTELDRQSQIYILREYIKNNFVDRGMCADFSLHDKGDGNPHAHIMLTTRPINEDGMWGAKSKKEYDLDKNGEKIKLKSGVWKSHKISATDWDKTESLEQWREQWALVCNREFEKNKIAERIDHRTLQAQGIDREPTRHLGSAAHQLEKRGIRTERGDINRETQSVNRELEVIKDKLVAAFAELQEAEDAPISAELPPNVEERAAPIKEERSRRTTRYQREKELKETIITYNFLKEHNINSFSEMDETLQSLWDEISSTKDDRKDNADTVVINKTTRQQKENHLRGTVNAYNFIKENGFSAIDGKLKSLSLEISDTTAKISALYDRKREVSRVIEITESYHQSKERLSRKDTPENRKAFQSVRKQLYDNGFKDLPNLEALNIEIEELNNGIKGFRAIKSEKEELYNGLCRVAQADRQEELSRESRGVAAPIGATAAAPTKKTSINEQIATAKIEADRINAERKTVTFTKKEL